MGDFRSYSRRVFAQWRISFAAVPFVVQIAAAVTGREIGPPNWVWLLALFVGLFYATFAVYRHDLGARPKGAEVVLSIETAHISAGGWSDPWPLEPKVIVVIELRNTSKEDAKVVSLEVVECELKTALLKAKPTKTKWQEKVSRKGAQFPFKLAGPDWIEMKGEIPVDREAYPTKEFYEQLGLVKEFWVTISCQYDDMRGNQGRVMATAKGGYKEMKNFVFKQLFQRNKELAFALLGTNLEQPFD